MQKRIVRKEAGAWKIRTDKGDLTPSEKNDLKEYFEKIEMPYKYSNGELSLPENVTWEEIDKRLSSFYGDSAEIFPF